MQDPAPPGSTTLAVSPMDLDQAKKRIEALEAQLIAQDHRLTHVVWTAVTRGWFGSKDPMRWPARRALVWCFFRPSAIALAAGGLVAWASLFFLYHQTQAIVEQNKQFDQQLQLQQSRNSADHEADYQTRKAQLLSILYDSDQKWPWSAEAPRASQRARAEAAVSFYRLQTENHAPVNLNRVVLQGADLIAADLPRIRLRYADLSGAILHGANLSEANLSDSLMTGAVFERANLTDAILDDCVLRDADFHGANLSNATLSGVDLSGATLVAANLRMAALHGANLSRAKLRHATLWGARLMRADLSEADLQDADLDGAQCGRSTRWPQGFDPSDPKHGLIVFDDQ